MQVCKSQSVGVGMNAILSSCVTLDELVNWQIRNDLTSILVLYFSILHLTKVDLWIRRPVWALSGLKII